jgi:inner membrane transporter RhtA
MHTKTAAPERRFAPILPFAAMLVTIVSVQFGAAFSKQLFPVLGVERTTFLRLGLGALMLAPILKPWKMRVPLGIAVALEFIGPFGLAIAFSHRRMDLLWVALAMAGLWLLLPLSQAFHAHAPALDGLGVMFALCAACCWAAYSLLARRIGNSQGPAIVALAMVIAALLILPLAAVQPGPIIITAHVALAAVVMALFSSALPFSLEMIALTAMPTRVYGTFTSLEPAVATLMGLMLLRELPTAAQLAGIAAVVAASVGTALFGA